MMVGTQRVIDTNNKLLVSLDEQKSEKENLHVPKACGHCEQISFSEHVAKLNLQLVATDRILTGACTIQLHVCGTYKDLLQLTDFDG